MTDAAPRAGASNPVDDLFQWFTDQHPSWTSWLIGVGLAFACAAIGLRGLYGWWRGEPPRPKELVPGLAGSVGYLVFGAWVLAALLLRGMPG